MIIAIDFDGTVVTHDFPNVGKDIKATPVLKRLVEAGHKIILYTMRSDGQKKYPTVLQDAIKWFEDREIPLFGVNENPGQKHWTNSPKVYAELYIDDAAAGISLQYDKDFHEKPFVDWNLMEMYLEMQGLFEPEKPRTNL